MGGGLGIMSEGKEHKGKMTGFVIVSCMMAAMGGAHFGYDIGISGGIAFLAGAALGGSAFNVYMVVLGRVLLGVGVGFANQLGNIVKWSLFLARCLPLSLLSGQRRLAVSFPLQLKEAGQSAGSFVGEVAKDAKGNVVNVAERVGSMFKSRWTLLQQPATRHAVQEQLIVAAASTGTFLRRGISETKDKVVVGKGKVEEVAKITALKSKTILTDIERWQKGVASTDVFGVPIELTVQRQQSSQPIPNILVRCADSLILSGLNSPNLFKTDGDRKVIQQLVSMYNQDPNALLPEGVSTVDVAALIKCYLASLPEPLTTFDLYNEIKEARSSVLSMKNVLRRLPNVNYMTLEFITALLLRLSKKSLLNKMDARSLAMEMAPVIMWHKEQQQEYYRQYWNMKPSSKRALDPPSWDMLTEENEGSDASSPIPLDDGMSIDFGSIEVVQCLIEHHNAIFTDANETIWR